MIRNKKGISHYKRLPIETLFLETYFIKILKKPEDK